MWLQFFLALPVFALLLYLPGHLIARSLTSDFVVAMSIAPMVSTCTYAVLGVVYEAVGIFTWWLVLVAPMTLLGVICLVVVHRRGAPAADLLVASKERHEELLQELGMYLPYIVFGAIACLVYFIKPLDGPSSFTWSTDNCHHLNLITRFVRSGEWSMLHASLYENLATAGIPGSTYYPAGWHVIVALAASALGESAPFASNVVHAVLISVTIPTSGYLLIRTVFYDKSLAVRLGAFLPLAFGVYPWAIIIPEAKESFFFGMVFAAACIALFVIACEHALRQEAKTQDVFFVLVGLLACFLAQPSTVFTIGVLLVPYIFWAVWRATDARGLTLAKRIFCELLFVVFVAAMWAIAFNIPTIHTMTLYMHHAYLSVSEALPLVISMGFKKIPAQPLLALLVWTGVAYSLHDRKYLWMTCGFLVFSLFFVVDATTDEFIKRVLTGFWFTDYDRLAASASITAAPLAGLGMYVIVVFAQRLFRAARKMQEGDASTCIDVAIPLACFIVFALVVYFPSFKLPNQETKITTAFGYVARRARTRNSVSNNTLDPEERAFLEKVSGVVGDALVINSPYDGSAFAYATNGINVYLRRYNDLGNDSAYIAEHLSEFATDTKLKELLEGLGAEYVLLLDIDEYESETSSMYERGFDASRWHGLVELDDETPGFEVVLSEGDMRLYRILYEVAWLR